MSDNIEVDLEAVSPLGDNVMEIEPDEVEEPEVVFVPFEDTPLRVNQTEKFFSKNRPYKVSRDEARILLEANKGYIKD